MYLIEVSELADKKFYRIANKNKELRQLIRNLRISKEIQSISSH